MVIGKYRVEITKVGTKIAFSVLAVLISMILVIGLAIGFEWFLHIFFSFLEVLV